MACSNVLHVVYDEMRRKLDAKDAKLSLFSYCDDMKIYRLIWVQMEKVVISRDIVFMKDSLSIGDDWKMHQNGRGETPIVVMVDESFKLSSFHNVEDVEEQVEDSDVKIKEVMERSTKSDIDVKRFGKKNRYSTRERKPLKFL